MSLKCVIIDDEKGAQSILQNYIKRLGNIELSGVFRDSVSAYGYLKKNKIDVAFLDINMPEIDGFALLDMLDRKPYIIFTTAYSDYALKGFEYNAVDYLHKPIRFERFIVALEKVEKLVFAEHYAKRYNRNIELKIDGVMRQIDVRDILFVESLGNYLKIHTQCSVHMLLMTLNKIEELLPADLFVRIHKSYIVNAAEVKNVITDKLTIVNTTLQIGKTYKKYFKEFMRNFENGS